MGNFIIFNISKKEIQTKDISKIQLTLESTLERKPLEYFQSTQIIFDGYDHDKREIFEIPEIREWTLHLLETNPEILFYTYPEFGGFQNLILCVSKVEKEFTLRDKVLLNVQTPSYLHSFLYETIRTSNKPKQLSLKVCNELLKFQTCS